MAFSFLRWAKSISSARPSIAIFTDADGKEQAALLTTSADAAGGGGGGGDASAANQTTEIAGLASIDGHVDGVEGVLGTAADAAVPTDANGTINAHIRGLIVAFLARTPVLGAAAKAASSPVTIATDDPTVVTLGATTDAAVSTDANGSINAHIRGLIVAFLARTPVVGQALMAASQPVVIASDQSLLPIDLTKNAGAADTKTIRVISATDDPGTVSMGAKTDTPATVADATSFSLIAVAKAIFKVLGLTSDAAVITDATGTIQQYLRGLVKLWIGGLAAGEAHIGQVGGVTAAVAGVTVTRPNDTTPYTAGDLMADNTTAGSVTPIVFSAARIAAGSGSIRRARCRMSGTVITNAQFRLHLYKALPTPSNGDNGAWLTDQSANYLGAIDVILDKVFTDGAAGNGVPIVGGDINFKLASGTSIWGLMEARGAFTPVALETFIWTLEVYQD